MKKILLGTTAIVAATAISAGAAKADIALDMWAYQGFGFAIESDKDTSENAGLVSYQNSNVDFVGSSTLDNGMTVGMTVDLNTVNANGGNVDEMRFSLTDDWGTVELGGNDTAADLLNHANHWVTANGVDSGTWSSYASNFSGGATASSLVGDEAGITYFSPVMNGLRFAVSYDSNDSTEGSGLGADTLSNIWSVGVEYNGEADGVSYGLGAGVDHAAGTTYEDAGGDDDASKFHIGGELSTGGFSVGVGYAAADYKTSSTAIVDINTVAATVSYSTGAHTVGVEYAGHESTSTVGGTTTDGDSFLVGYNYSVGGGVYWDARIAVLDENTGTASTDTDATIFETGVGVSF